MEQKLTVIILAAGLGTRMRSRRAKVLHKAGGLTLVEHVVNTACAVTAPDNVIIVVGHQADQVKAALDGRGVQFALQTEQKGTGDAVRVCSGIAGGRSGRVAILYGDCPLLSVETLRKLIAVQDSSHAAATVITIDLDDPTGYGRIVERDGYVEAIVEQKVATEEQKRITQINSGIYCFDAALLWKHLPEIQANPVSQEFYLTDIVEIFHRAGHRVKAMLHPDSDELLGINTRVELAAIDRLFRERKARELMLSGVTIYRPETVTIDAGVEIGPDTVVEPFVHLLGRTRIGSECRIGAGAIIEDSILADEVTISQYTMITTSRVAEKATIGPFARLRMDNDIAAGAHIGNFVEMKKARLGAKSKAGHLAYLGDAEIGAGVNIGAGTITCNYDGTGKFRTGIADRVFVGSNSTLVAPVDVREGAYIAAGSVITEEVPADALAIGRSRQTNKSGWAKRRREKNVAKKG